MIPAGHIKLRCPEGCTQLYGQVSSDDDPAVYRPELIDGELLVTVPANIVTPSLLDAGFVIIEGTMIERVPIRFFDELPVTRRGWW